MLAPPFVGVGCGGFILRGFTWSCCCTEFLGGRESDDKKIDCSHLRRSRMNLFDICRNPSHLPYAFLRRSQKELPTVQHFLVAMLWAIGGF